MHLKQKYNRVVPSGQSMSEYSVVFGLVVVVAIAAVVMIGNQNSDLLESANRELFSKQVDGNNRAEQLVGSLSSNNNSPSRVRITLQDGATMSFSSYPTRISSSVQVTGANGTITNLSLTLKEMANQLKEQGKIDQEQYNTLSKLANQGHNMAAVTELLESHAKNSSDKTTFANSKLMYEGREVFPGELACALGGTQRGGSKVCEDLSVPYASLSKDATDLYGGAAASDLIGLEPAKFLQMYAEASNYKAFQDDPKLGQVFNQLSWQILILTQYAATTTSNIAADIYPDNKPESFRDNILSRATHMDSASICNMGTTKDSGVFCPES